MSPVRFVGAFCSRCGKRPAARSLDVCAKCAAFLAAFGKPVPSGHPWHSHGTEEFSTELDEWRAA